MGKIAHLKVSCPQCGKYTSIYVEENGGSSSKVKCEHCKQIFEFGAGMMYEPVGYVPEIPQLAMITDTENASSGHKANERRAEGSTVQCPTPMKNIAAVPPIAANNTYSNRPVEVIYPNKKKGLATGLWFAGAFGFLNIHNFYLGKVKIGLIRLVAYFIIVAIGQNYPQALVISQIFAVGLFAWNIVDLVQIMRLPKDAFGKSGQATGYSSASAASAVSIGYSTASTKNLRCPGCGAEELTIVGVKGVAGKTLAATLAVGGIIGGAIAAKDTESKPVEYICDRCRNKFVAPAHEASPDELLSAPCAIHFERVGGFVGAAVPQTVYLNGIRIAVAKNGKTIAFPTNVRYNTLFVTDQYGTAFKCAYRFEAQPGGSVLVRFNRKFV